MTLLVGSSELIIRIVRKSHQILAVCLMSSNLEFTVGILLQAFLKRFDQEKH